MTENVLVPGLALFAESYLMLEAEARTHLEQRAHIREHMNTKCTKGEYAMDILMRPRALELWSNKYCTGIRYGLLSNMTLDLCSVNFEFMPLHEAFFQL